MHEHHHLHNASDECPPTGGYCRTHELNILLLAALYAVSRVLATPAPAFRPSGG